MQTENLDFPVAEVISPLDSEKLVRVTEILKSVAHPLRISIVQLLADGEPKMVTEIYKHLNIEQAEASRQLGILKRTGILTANREGKTIKYALAEPEIIAMLKCMERCSIH